MNDHSLLLSLALQKEASWTPFGEFLYKEAKQSAEQKRAKQRAYYQKNKEKIKQKSRSYAKNNRAELSRKAKIRNKQIRTGARRQRKRLNTGSGGYSYAGYR